VLEYCQICVNTLVEELASASDGRPERLDLVLNTVSDSAVVTGTGADRSLRRQTRQDERTPPIVKGGVDHVLSLPMLLKHMTNVEGRSRQTGSVDHHYRTRPRPSSCELAKVAIDLTGNVSL
jgi:hypothetical protein